MPSEMCPSCRQLRNMRVTVATRTETGADGKKRTIKTTSYQCEVCSKFVRSEERDEQAVG